MHSDTFGYIRKCSEAFGHFRNFSEFFYIFALVPNTGEANEEICAPMAPKISEMCFLKLENKYRLRLQQILSRDRCILTSVEKFSNLV